jgi:demethylmenaquinone methyltransferase/2-methoxy-6-polyprenyl-1,4-benzoquinol methylase
MKSQKVDFLFNLYARMAPRYDLYAQLLPLLGFQQMRYRTLAIDALHLKPGDIAVDVGCGTGLNFCHLEKTIGPSGKIIGVDLSDAMLEQARMRIAEGGWRNIELVCSDAAEFTFPPKVGGIISTFALTLLSEYDAVIGRGAEALAAGARWCVLDFKIPTNWLSRLAPVLARVLVVPFGGTFEMGQRHPWESIQKYLDLVLYREVYFGCAYIAVGQR